MTSTDREQAWIDGNRAAWLGLLRQALRELGIEDKDPVAELARKVAHIEETRAALREVCADHGDNDWDDKLHLADVVNKHLAPYLGEDEEP